MGRLAALWASAVWLLQRRDRRAVRERGWRAHRHRAMGAARHRGTRRARGFSAFRRRARHRVFARRARRNPRRPIAGGGRLAGTAISTWRHTAAADGLARMVWRIE